MQSSGVNGDTEPVRVGKLELRDEFFTLHGGAEQREVQEQNDYPDIKAIRRFRLGSLPA